MAKETYKNTSGGVLRFTLRDGKDPVRVKDGGYVTTDDEEVKTALKKSGGFEKSSASEKREKED